MNTKVERGKELGERMLVAVKEFVAASLEPVRRQLRSFAEDFIALGRRQSSTDELLDDLNRRIEALEKVERERDAPRLRQVN